MPEHIANQHHQAVGPLATVDRLCGDEQPHARRKAQHSSSSASTTRRNSRLSIPSATRRTRPLRRTISTCPSERGAGVTSTNVGAALAELVRSNRRRQKYSRCASMPSRCANAVTERPEPASALSTTSASAGVHRPRPVSSASLRNFGIGVSSPRSRHWTSQSSTRRWWRGYRECDEPARPGRGGRLVGGVNGGSFGTLATEGVHIVDRVPTLLLKPLMPLSRDRPLTRHSARRLTHRAQFVAQSHRSAAVRCLAHSTKISTVGRSFKHAPSTAWIGCVLNAGMSFASKGRFSSRST